MVFSPELTWPTSAVTGLLSAHPRMTPIQSKSSTIHETYSYHPSFAQADAMLFELLQLKFQLQSTSIQTVTNKCVRAVPPKGR
jgi:hypothetical protein